MSSVSPENKIEGTIWQQDPQRYKYIKVLRTFAVHVKKSSKLNRRMASKIIRTFKALKSKNRY